MFYSVTFEHDTKAPVTVRGEIDTQDVDIAMRRAIRALERAYPRAPWSSFVLVLEKPRQ